MIKTFLRHWALLDLAIVRPWLTDERIKQTPIIDNKDGTRGLAFDLRELPSEAMIASSETMQTVLRLGHTQAIEPLPSGPPRRLRPAPSLHDLVAQWGGYDRIPEHAWRTFQRDAAQWREDVRLGYAEVRRHDHD